MWKDGLNEKIYCFYYLIYSKSSSLIWPLDSGIFDCICNIIFIKGDGTYKLHRRRVCEICSNVVPRRMIASSIEITRYVFEMCFIKAVVKEWFITHKRGHWLYCFWAIILSLSPCEIGRDSIFFLWLFKRHWLEIPGIRQYETLKLKGPDGERKFRGELLN